MSGEIWEGRENSEGFPGGQKAQRPGRAPSGLMCEHSGQLSESRSRCIQLLTSVHETTLPQKEKSSVLRAPPCAQVDLQNSLFSTPSCQPMQAKINLSKSVWSGYGFELEHQFEFMVSLTWRQWVSMEIFTHVYIHVG